MGDTGGSRDSLVAANPTLRAFVKACATAKARDNSASKDDLQLTAQELVAFAQSLSALKQEMRPAEIIAALRHIQTFPIAGIVTVMLAQSPLPTLRTLGWLQKQLWDRFFRLAIEMMRDESQSTLREDLKSLCMSISREINHVALPWLSKKDDEQENQIVGWHCLDAYASVIVPLARDALCSDAGIRKFMGHDVSYELLNMIYGVATMPRRGRAIARKLLSPEIVGQIWYHQTGPCLRGVQTYDPRSASELTNPLPRIATVVTRLRHELRLLRYLMGNPSAGQRIDDRAEPEAESHSPLEAVLQALCTGR
ncbi:unnamed protein product [Parajaminaea phylloscopi]